MITFARIAVAMSVFLILLCLMRILYDCRSVRTLWDSRKTAASFPWSWPSFGEHSVNIYWILSTRQHLGMEQNNTKSLPSWELTFLQGETENNPLNIQCAGWLDMQQREQSPVEQDGVLWLGAVLLSPVVWSGRPPRGGDLGAEAGRKGEVVLELWRSENSSVARADVFPGLGKAAGIAAGVEQGEVGDEVGVAEPQITEGLRVKAWLWLSQKRTHWRILSPAMWHILYRINLVSLFKREWGGAQGEAGRWVRRK